jgi:hypothetical protein
MFDIWLLEIVLDLFSFIESNEDIEIESNEDIEIDDENLVLNISEKNIRLLYKLLLGYGLFIAIYCLRKLAAFV